MYITRQQPLLPSWCGCPAVVALRACLLILRLLRAHGAVPLQNLQLSPVVLLLLLLHVLLLLLLSWLASVAGALPAGWWPHHKQPYFSAQQVGSTTR